MKTTKPTLFDFATNIARLIITYPVIPLSLLHYLFSQWILRQINFV